MEPGSERRKKNQPTNFIKWKCLLGGKVRCSYIDWNWILMWEMESNIKKFTVHILCYQLCMAEYDCEFHLPQQDIVAITFYIYFCLWKFHQKWNEYQKWCFDLVEDNKNLWEPSYRYIELRALFLLSGFRNKWKWFLWHLYESQSHFEQLLFILFPKTKNWKI